MKLSPQVLLAGFLCFIAASISSAGGIGGGGLFIPILTIFAGFDLKTASSFSAFMVTGGSIANVACNMFIKSGQTLIDYDVTLLSQPCMLLGVSVGVICNLVFPEWLIQIFFAVFLGWTSFRTCKSGVVFWNLESEKVRRNGEFCESEGGVMNGAKETLLGGEEKGNLGIPWMKLVALILIWFFFFFLYLLRGNRYGQSIIPMKVCGVGYWLLSSMQIPVTIVSTAWILYQTRNQRLQYHTSNREEICAENNKGVLSDKVIFSIMALLAGVLGGVFGIGGGMLISPLLLHFGMPPEVTAATCSFMVFFSSTMSAFQYVMLGMEHIDVALIFAAICFVASLIGLMMVQRAIANHGRASLTVFSVGTVMVLSTLLITSFGALDVWRDYKSGKYMGFKSPC